MAVAVGVSVSARAVETPSDRKLPEFGGKLPALDFSLVPKSVPGAIDKILHGKEGKFPPLAVKQPKTLGRQTEIDHMPIVVPSAKMDLGILVAKGDFHRDDGILDGHPDLATRKP